MENITSLMNEDDDNSLLVIIADLNIYSWGQRAQIVQTEGPEGRRFPLITLPTFLDHLLVFINSYLMLNQENQISLISSVIGESYFIYPQPQHTKKKDQRCIPEQIQASLKNINQLLEENLEKKKDEDSISSFSAAMSLALCYINRIKKEFPSLRARILVFNLSPDVSTQYIPVMNCIFSAQKQSIPVDSCVLSTADSTFLQQASHLTNGIYLKPQRQENLSQYLLSTFLVDSFSRKYLSVPTLKTVDFRASCFCHKKIVDIGFVCSVCLSIFCKHSSSCSTCGTKFALKYDLPKLKSEQQPAATTTTTTTKNNGDSNNNNNNSNNNNNNSINIG